MLKSLRKKFILVTMSIVTGMLLIIFALVYSFTSWNLESQSEAMLKTLLVSASRPNATQQQPGPLPYFTIYINSRGDMLASGVTNYDISSKAFLQEIIDGINAEGQKNGVLSRYNLRYSVHTGYGEQRIALVDISSHKATLATLLRVSIAVSIFSLGVFFVVSILLAHWAVRPVEDAWQKQRQFVSDASHELKTPLTVIMSNAELLQGDDWSSEEKGQFAKNILTVSHQMRHLVEGMLELARADNRQQTALFTPVDFSALISRTALPFEPVLFEKSIMLELSVAPDIQINGSENHLRQIVEILLDNAGKYACPGVVAVTLQKQSKGQCLLAASSPGNPIPRENLPKIFERFYRVDTARERNGSFGLGLSIAKAIVTDHGGKIWAESNETGNCFFVQLPCL